MARDTNGPRSRRSDLARVAFLIAAGALTALVLTFGRDGADGEVTDDAIRSPAARATGGSPPAASAGGLSALPPQDPAVPPSIDLASKLRESTDIRAFAVEAGRHPELGGISYAQYAAGRCWLFKQYLSRHLGNRLPENPGEDPALVATRRSAYQRMESACRNVSMTDHLGDRRAQGDAIHGLTEQAKAAVASGDRQERRRALAAVLANGDPLLLDGTLVLLLTQRLPERRGVGYWIDGRLMPAAPERDRTANARTHTYVAALKLLPCRMGLVCDERDIEVFASCVSAGKCYVDRIQMARDAMPPEHLPTFDRDLDSLEQAVRNRDLDRLLPAS